MSPDPVGGRHNYAVLCMSVECRINTLNSMLGDRANFGLCAFLSISALKNLDPKRV